MSGFEGSERFEIVREIGAGGMGVVFEAVDLEQDTRVALKTMQRLRPLELYRFKQEFRSLANIVHPNLIRLYELVSDGREWFYTMELVDGQDFLAHVRPMPEIDVVEDDPTMSIRADSLGDIMDYERLRKATFQLVEGVHTLHRRGKLHRDIKPSNVLVRGDGRVLLLDFGLVKDLADDTESKDRDIRDYLGTDYYMESIATDGRVVGSIPYMAPEQAAGGTLTEASDWYAVGVVLFEALTGSRPFNGTAEEVLLGKQKKDPPRPTDLVPKLPEDLARICSALLSREPEDRPSGDELLEALRVEMPDVEAEGTDTESQAAVYRPPASTRHPAPRDGRGARRPWLTCSTSTAVRAPARAH